MIKWKLSARRGPIGLDIGERWIKAIQLSGDRTRVEAAATLQRAPAESADNMALTFAEAARLVSVLRRRGFVGRRAVVAVPDRAVLTSLLELPPRGSGAPIEQIARSELAHAHRREADQMEVVCWDIPASGRPSEGTPAMAAGCDHADANALLDPLEAAGLVVEALDLSCWALARICTGRTGLQPASPTSPAPAASPAPNAPNASPAPAVTTAIADLGWNFASLVLLHRGAVVYERNLPSAGMRQLAMALESSHGFTPDVIEYILRDLGFGDDPRAPELKGPDDADLLLKARSLLESHYDGLAQELRLAISYAQHQYSDASVNDIALTGGGAGVPGLTSYMTQRVGSPVTILTPADVLTGPGGGELRDEMMSPALTVAAGLARHGGKEATSCAA